MSEPLSDQAQVEVLLERLPLSPDEIDDLLFDCSMPGKEVLPADLVTKVGELLGVKVRVIDLRPLREVLETRLAHERGARDRAQS